MLQKAKAEDQNLKGPSLTVWLWQVNSEFVNLYPQPKSSCIKPKGITPVCSLGSDSLNFGFRLLFYF